MSPRLRRQPKRWALGVAVGALIMLAALPSRAQAVLNCGAINPHTQVYAYAAGQPAAQETDMAEHTLPWTNDLRQDAASSSARKHVEASCQAVGSSVLVTLASTEWAALGADRPNDAVKASWAPTWTTQVQLPAGKQLTISVASSVNLINCQLAAPGVSMIWAGPYSNVQTVPGGAGEFTVTLGCTSGGLHEINRNVLSGWVNGEQILVDMTVLDAQKASF